MKPEHLQGRKAPQNFFLPIPLTDAVKSLAREREVSASKIAEDALAAAVLAAQSGNSQGGGPSAAA